MLNLAKCIVHDSAVYDVSSSVLAMDEGIALVNVIENGKLTVKASTGAAGEVFLGVSQSRFVTPSNANTTYTGTIPASPYQVTLPKTPVSTTNMAVYINGTLAAKVASGQTAGQYAITGGVISFASADTGLPIVVIYSYALTNAEAIMLFGNDLASTSMVANVKMSAINTGVIYTDQFVLSDDWNALGTVYLGANGKFTKQTGGASINATIYETPASAGGWLGLILQPN